jgi:acetyl coenzyme A synthetase (ADP forming)-like protein
MTVTLHPPYPSHFESDVVLRNGRTLRLRPVRIDDHDAMLAFFKKLSSDSLHSRFFDARTPESALRDTPLDIDYEDDFGVVGEEAGEIIAVAHYFRSRRNTKVAEVAFTIADRAQGRGIGTRLLEKLADVARTKKIETFFADVLPENRPMLDVFLYSGFNVTSRSEEGSVHVAFSIEPTEMYAEAAAERSQKAAYASMKSIFEPRAIAIVGASRHAGHLGTAILDNLKTTGFTGSLYVVHPIASEIDGVAVFPSLTAIPGGVDLAIIAVPADRVESVIDDCVTKGVGAVVIITAGFGETGEAGRAAELRILEKVRDAGIRMVGPNCMGVINTAASVNMHATFSPVFPPRGNVAMSSQSGALGLAILDYARMLNIGFSTFISVGNKADVSGNDLIQYWAEDLNTDVMLLYLESFGNPKRFGEIARRVARKKPIVAVKSGRSAAGARAASSHTGALASSDALVDDLFKQAGVIRTDTLEELFDVATLFANQPLPGGRRVAIATNAGGPGILAADACSAAGLEIAQLSDATLESLRALLPPAASVRNPVDMIASASADHYRRSLRLLLDDPNVDAVIALYIPVVAKDAEEVAAAIREAAEHANGKTLLATFMTVRGVPSSLAPVPAFPFPERAANALARATRYAEWRSRPVGVVQHFDDFDTEAMRAVIDRALARGAEWLDATETYALLLGANIPVARLERVDNVYDAVSAAMRMGFAVVLKAEGPSLLHKTEADAVKLSLADEREVREAYDELQSRLGDGMTGAIVQQMVSGGVEVMVGSMEDPTFGQVVAFGAGGTLVELLSDVTLRMHPLTDVDADDMIAATRTAKLLRGFRGAKPSDIGAVKEVLLRVSAMLTTCPEIAELDLNPLKVLENGAYAVDARVRVKRVAPKAPSRRVSY